MKRRPAFFLALTLVLSPALAAQDSGADSSYIGYRLLKTWADNSLEDGRRAKNVATSILVGGGWLLGGSAAATWYFGDDISQTMTGSPMDFSFKRDLSLGLGIGGVGLIAAGAIVALVPVRDYRVVYAEVFTEPDPAVREAIAVSVLQTRAKEGRERRITSFVASILIPVIAVGLRAGFNVSDSKPWNDGLLETFGSAACSIGGGITSLLSTTPEERLYQRYLAANSAYQRDIGN